MRLFDNRLNVLTGVRFEHRSATGLGPLVDAAAVWERTPNGDFARDENGNRIRKPEAGANNSLEQRALTHQERGARASKSYDGYYPSIHLTYNFNANFLARLAYAKTYGPPSYNELIRNTVVEEDDIDLSDNPDAMPGRLRIQNIGLRPWTAHNYDLSLEYYTDQGAF